MIHSISTPIGWIAYIITSRGLFRTCIGFGTEREAIDRMNELCDTSKVNFSSNSDLIDYWNGVFQNIFSGPIKDTTSIPIDDSFWTDFQKSVYYTLLRKVPWGSVITYGALALEAVGYPAARAVGYAMAHNPIPPVIPCHRVVSADGRLGGFSAEGGIALKEKMLALERSQGVKHPFWGREHLSGRLRESSGR